MSKHDRDENLDDEAPLQQSIKRLKLETGQDIVNVRPANINQEVQTGRKPYQMVYDEYVPVNSLLHQLHLERQYRLSQRNAPSQNHSSSNTEHSSMDVSD